VAAAQDFQSFQEQRQEAVSGFQEKRTEEFQDYRQKIREAFSEYKEKAAAVWGEEKAAVPDRKQWVSYRDAMRERRMVDFEEGEARYQVALEPGEEDAPEAARDRLVDAIVESVLKGPDRRSIVDIAENPEQTESAGDPLLAGMFRTDAGKPVTEENAREFANKAVANKVKKSRVKGEDGKERVVVGAEIPMIPDHVRKRAEKYEGVVDKQAERQSLDPELVYAVIETESFFNPQARSHVPAFGLMQLVPVSGGREAYRVVHGVDRAPSEQFLYQPRNNVELGAAYLHRLYFDYMDDIDNRKARMWCAVAAYNTGPGNLYDTFAPEGGKSDAMAKINGMSGEEVFQYLVENLPYEETQHYVQKVRKKMPKYRRM
jgi:membrane-bound lytic murein transglycosylase C